MTDFHEKGFSCIKLLNPKFPRRARKEVDLDEIVALLSQVVGRPIETLPIPNTPAFHDLVKEVEKNMCKCWERFGKKWLKPTIISRHLTVFLNSKEIVEMWTPLESILILIPIFTVSHVWGAPTLLQGSHHDNNEEGAPYDPSIVIGQALMLDGRLKMRYPKAGGGVCLLFEYDMKGLFPLRH